MSNTLSTKTPPETPTTQPVDAATPCSVSFSGGVAELNLGDKFEIAFVEPYGPNGLYEIAEFEQSDRTYSPSGFGGTPTIIGRHVETGTTVEFCGDSVAGAVVRYRKTQNDQVVTRQPQSESQPQG